MDIHFHDNTPAKPGEPHGLDGPTHAGSVSVDYEYQVEMWVSEVEADHPKLVRVRCPDLKREWERGADGKMSEVAWTGNVMDDSEVEAAGIKAIIALQKTVGIVETEAQAKAGWASMSLRERAQTMAAYAMVCTQ